MMSVGIDVRFVQKADIAKDRSEEQSGGRGGGGGRQASNPLTP